MKYRNPVKKSLRIAGIFLIFFQLLAFELIAQIEESSLPLPYVLDDVNALEEDTVNNRVFVGGQMSYSGDGNGPLFILTKDSLRSIEHSLDVSFGTTEGYISGHCPDGSGGFFISGNFTHINGQVRNGFAHITDQLDLLPSSPDIRKFAGGSESAIGEIEQMKTKGDTLFISGDFRTVNGEYRNSFAALSISTMEVLPFDLGLFNNLPMHDFELRGDTLIIGGFERAGIESFGFTMVNPGSNPTVIDPLFVHNNHTLLASDQEEGWYFFPASMNPDEGGYLENGLYKLEVDGSVELINPNFDLQTDGFDRVIAGVGYLDGGLSFRAHSIETGITEKIQFNEAIRGYASSGDTVFVGGDFDVAGQVRFGSRALDSSTGEPVQGYYSPDMEAVSATPYQGGFIVAYENEDEYEVRRINQQGQIDGFKVVADGPIQSLMVQNDTLYLGGFFNELNGQDRPALGVVDLLSSELLDFQIEVNAPDEGILSMELMNDTLIIGGLFSSINGEERNSLAFIRQADFELLDLNIPVTWNNQAGRIECLEILGDELFIGGIFDELNFAERSNLGSISLPTLQISELQPAINSIVFDLAISSSSLFVGGNFTTINGADMEGIARFLLEDYSLDGDFTVLNDRVTSLEIRSDTLYMSGNFTEVNGTGRKSLVAINSDSGELYDWGTPYSGLNFKLALNGSKLFVVSDQTAQFGGENASNFLALDAETLEVLPYEHSFPEDFQFNYLTIKGDTILVIGFDLNELIQKIFLMDKNTGEFFTEEFEIPGSRFERIDDEKLLVTGNFTDILGEERDGAAIIQLSSMTLSDWEFDISGNVNSLNVVPFGENFVATAIGLNAVNGVQVENLCLINPDGEVTVDFLPNVSFYDDVTALYGGEFLTVAGALEMGSSDLPIIACFDLNTGEMVDFENEIPSEFEGQEDLDVFDMLVNGNDLIVSVARGIFGSVSQIDTSLFSLDLDTGEITDYTLQGENVFVRKMLVHEDDLYMFASSTSTLSQIDGLISLDLDNGIINDWYPQFMDNRKATSFFIDDNLLHLAGGFVGIDGETRLRYARYDLTSEPPSLTEIQTTFPESATNGHHFSLTDSTFFFNAAPSQGGRLDEHLLVYDPESGEIDLSVPKPDGQVWDVEIYGEKVFLTGNFNSVGGESRWRFAALNRNDLTLSEWDPNLESVGLSLIDFTRIRFADGKLLFRQLDQIYSVDTIDGGNFEVLIDEAEVGGFITIFDVHEDQIYFSAFNEQNEIVVKKASLDPFQITELDLGLESPIESLTQLSISRDKLILIGDWNPQSNNSSGNIAVYDPETEETQSWPLLFQGAENGTVLNTFFPLFDGEGRIFVPVALNNPSNDFGIFSSSSIGGNFAPVLMEDFSVNEMILDAQGDLLIAADNSSWSPTFPRKALYTYDLDQPCYPDPLCQDAMLTIDNTGYAVLSPFDLVGECNFIEGWVSSELFNCSDGGDNEVTASYITVLGDTVSCSVNVEVDAGDDQDGDGIPSLCDLCFGQDSSGDSDNDGICDDSEIVGCQDPSASNYNPDATDEGICQYTYPDEAIDVYMEAMDDELGGRPDFELFPNPSKLNDITLKLQDNETKKYTLQIHDVFGRIVYKDRLTGMNFQIPGSVFESEGVYSVIVYGESKVMKEQLVIVR
jgi:hypothetical protein